MFYPTLGSSLVASCMYKEIIKLWGSDYFKKYFNDRHPIVFCDIVIINLIYFIYTKYNTLFS
jgi:hypothetical protein